MIGGIPHNGHGPSQVDHRQRETCQRCGEDFILETGQGRLCRRCSSIFYGVVDWLRDAAWIVLK